MRIAFNGIRAVFHRPHPQEEAFIDSIEDYLAFCAERNENPEQPFFGKFNLRIPPELHREAYIAAKQEGKSLNSWVCDIFKAVYLKIRLELLHLNTCAMRTQQSNTYHHVQN